MGGGWERNREKTHKCYVFFFFFLDTPPPSRTLSKTKEKRFAEEKKMISVNSLW